jgi:hypothetical protein
MADFDPSMPHGNIEEVFPNVFFVTGTMQGEFFGSLWQFSRNMTVVRDGEQLTLINAVRLDDDGLAALDQLGKVTNVAKIGSLHGKDDAFYVDRYGATLWAMPGMEHAGGLKADRLLTVGGEMPFSSCSLFAFEESKLPEGILRIDREGGILVSCDALQNWVSPDEFFFDETKETMEGMGFFQSANIGPVWMKTNEPKPGDFARLKDVQFSHVLCGHGEPLRDTAQDDFARRFKAVFDV